MISAVFDTNILVSASCFPNSSIASLVHKWLDDEFELVLSEYILTEFASVMARDRIQSRFKVSDTYTQKTISTFRSLATIVKPEFVPHIIDRDPADNDIIACALAGKVDFLVTGDKDLLSVSAHSGISIVTASVFNSVLKQTR